MRIIQQQFECSNKKYGECPYLSLFIPVGIGKRGQLLAITAPAARTTAAAVGVCSAVTQSIDCFDELIFAVVFVLGDVAVGVGTGEFVAVGIIAVQGCVAVWIDAFNEAVSVVVDELCHSPFGIGDADDITGGASTP